MPTKHFSLSPDESSDLSISWKGYFKNLRVELAGNLIAEFASRGDLKKGREIPLPDGRVLSIKQAKNSFSSMAGNQLEILVDGAPVPGSATHPETKVTAARGIIYFIAGLNIGLGVIAWIWNVEFLRDLGLGWVSIIYGFAFAGLGILTQKGSMAALALAILFFSLDALLVLLVAIEFVQFPIASLIIRVFLIAGMVEGLLALNRMRGPNQMEIERQLWKQPLGMITGLLSVAILILVIFGFATTDSAFHVTNDKEKFDQSIAAELKALAEQLPLKIDEETNLDAARMDGEEVHYTFRFPNLEFNPQQASEFQAETERQVKVSQCSNPAVLAMLRNGKTIIHVYLDSDGTKVGEVHIQPTDCQQ